LELINKYNRAGRRIRYTGKAAVVAFGGSFASLLTIHAGYPSEFLMDDRPQIKS